MNSINAIGKLTRDPELRSTAGGMQVCTMRLAIPRRKRAGEDKGAVFIDVVAFDRLGENSAKYLAKGSNVAIVGRLEHREWEAQDGSKRSAHEIIAQEVEFLDPAPTSEQSDQAPENVEEQQQDASDDASTAAQDEQPQTKAPARRGRRSQSKDKELAGTSA